MFFLRENRLLIKLPVFAENGRFKENKFHHSLYLSNFLLRKRQITGGSTENLI